MQRLKGFLVLTAIGAALSIHASDAMAGKGFSVGGGASFGGSNFSGSMRSSGGPSMHSGPSLGSRNISSFSPGSSTLRNVKVGSPSLGNGFGRTVQTMAGGGVPGIKTMPRLANGPAPGGNVPNGQPAGGIGGGVNPGSVLGKHMPGNFGRGVAGVTGVGGGAPVGNPIGQAGPSQGPTMGGGHVAPHAVGGGNSNCRRVIDMLVRQCHANQFRDPSGRPHCVDPAWGNIGWIPGPFAPPVAIEQMIGDLELVGVNLATDATPEHGPLYQVSFRNNSRNNIENFRVSLVAVFGEITENSPTVTVDVPRLDAGQTGTVQVQMPAAVMAMGPQGQQAVAFDTLVVAIDSFDELVESNEVNNVATVKRAEIQVIVVEAPATAPAAVAPVAPADAAPGDGAALAPAEGAPAPGGAAPAPAPAEKIDLDNLDLGDADATVED